MFIEAVVISQLGFMAPADVKCPRTHHLPGFPAESAVVLIDGEIQGSNLEWDPDQLDAEDVARVQITCWNPETDELPARNGVQLIVITTKNLEQSTRAEIEDGVASVQRFSDQHDRLPDAIGDLDLTAVAATRLEYTRSESSWTVTTSGPRAYLCSASGTEGTDADRVDVRCRVSHELAKRNLRDAYERTALRGGTLLRDRVY